ncbi:uncharacterized mitochondrial protein AtMg00860-like [Typha latifolia]|uniref:uncharacterized mitochondrial protein AtMg00860-like n=1 Tax=Typha latifolia TaxID=4733 RepID=UPI003C2F5C3B
MRGDQFDLKGCCQTLELAFKLTGLPQADSHGLLMRLISTTKKPNPGVEADLAKAACRMRWPRPKTPKELQGFLNLTDYYCQFIQDYGKIAAPLIALLCKGRLERDDKAERTFEELKQAMTETPVLALPDFTKTFVIECDASGLGISAILMQEE